MFPAPVLESVHAFSVSCVSVFPRSQSLPGVAVLSAPPWWSSAQVRWSSAPVWWSSAPPWWSSAQVRWSSAPVWWSSAPQWWSSAQVQWSSAPVWWSSAPPWGSSAQVWWSSAPPRWFASLGLSHRYALVALSACSTWWLCPVCSALVGSCPTCSTLVGSCPVCSALVGSCHACSALGDSCHTCSALGGSCSVGSALAPCSVGFTLVYCSAMVFWPAGSASAPSLSTSTWTWPSIPPPVPPPLHCPPGLYRSVWKPLLGGGGGYVTNPVRDLPSTHHQRSLFHQIDSHTTQNCYILPWTTIPIIHCTDDTQLVPISLH